MDGEFSYNPDTGVIIRASTGVATMTAKDGKGYCHGTVNGRTVRAHRLAWRLYYGEWPDGDIDHINGDKTDNRIDNLRSVTHAENMRNRKIRRDNRSGVSGVHWEKSRSRWRVTVGSKFLGRFNCFGQAINRRREKALEEGYVRG